MGMRDIEIYEDNHEEDFDKAFRLIEEMSCRLKILEITATNLKTGGCQLDCIVSTEFGICSIQTIGKSFDEALEALEQYCYQDAEKTKQHLDKIWKEHWANLMEEEVIWEQHMDEEWLDNLDKDDVWLASLNRDT